jgi:hypothetical protein
MQAVNVKASSPGSAEIVFHMRTDLGQAMPPVVVDVTVKANN